MPKAVTGHRCGLLEIRRHLDGHQPSVPATTNLYLAASELRYCRGNSHSWSSEQLFSGPFLFSGYSSGCRGSM